jgi:DNA repair protein RecO (recombination protein O)
MNERTTGLILRTRLLTESSLIIHWLTPDFGRISTVARGARRANSPLRGKLDLYYLADFSFRRSRRSELHTLCEARLRDTHSALRQDLGYLKQAAYCTALIEQTTETETPLPQIFDLLTGLLRQLPLRPPRPPAIFAFELKLLRELGQSPAIQPSKLSQGTKQILEKLVELDWPDLCRLNPSASQTREIQRFLHAFLMYHLEKIPDKRNAALAPDASVS